MTNEWYLQSLLKLGALALVFPNGFFVAAEFALVKIRRSRVDTLVEERRAFSELVRQQLHNLDAWLSACQLGITLASLGLGWIAEPALAAFSRGIFVSHCVPQ